VTEEHRSLRERLHGMEGVIMLIGAADTGKTTLGRQILVDAIDAGMTAAYVDGDVAADTVGHPACAGVRIVRTHEDLQDLHTSDEMRFVGSTEPAGVVLPHVVAVSSLVASVRDDVDVVVVDTTGMVAGVVGQTLKYHLMELVRPSLVIAMQRGGEMEPTIGMLRRFLSARVAVAHPPADLVPSSPVERSSARRRAFARAFAEPLSRWRVQTAVFAPTLPEGFDLTRLDGMLVGVQDDHGHCLGLGALEAAEGAVRVATRHGDAMRGLRLGSLRIDLSTFATTRVRLRDLIFGI